MTKGLRPDIWMLAGLGAAAAGVVTWLIVRGMGGGASPLVAVPSDAFMVVSVDVVALARSPLGETVMAQLKDEAAARADAVLGVDSITSTCGFDPLPSLRAMAVALPEESSGDAERGDFGVAVAGTFSKDSLATCARAVVSRRGGEPTTKQVGSFTVISDARSPGGAEMAYRDGGPYLVGRGGWLLRMIDAADGRTLSVLEKKEEGHARLRDELKAHDTDAEAIVATAILPRNLRERLEGEIARESKGAKAMEGVLGVSAAALGLHAGRAHEEARLAGELHCDSVAACEAVSTLILHTRLLWSGNLGYRLFGLGPLIDNLQVHAEPTRTSLYIGTRASADDLAAMLDRALKASPKKPSAPEIRGASEPLPGAPDAGK